MGDYDKAFQVIEERHQAEVKALQDEIIKLKSTKSVDQSAGWRETVNKLKAEILDRDKEVERLQSELEAKKAPPKKKAAHK